MTDKPKLKQTEVGMIPSDWEVKTLGELVDMSSGTTPSRFNEKNFQGNVCWLSSGELKSHYIYNTKEKISEDAASSMRLYPKGTVVIAMYGLEAEGVRGTSSILAKECTISQACMAFTNLREINNEYFYYWYAANGNEIGTKYAQGTKQQNLSPEVMKNVIIPLPPTIEEQQRIANALSDVDALIANLEKLIAKKKNIKQGAMQQLLTGRKRLPGFAGKWSDFVLGQSGFLLKNSINPQFSATKFFSEYSMPAYDDARKPERVLGCSMHSNRTQISGEVLLFNKLNVRQKRVWYVSKCAENAVCSMEFLPYCSKKIDLQLLRQILLTDGVTSDFIGMSTGTSNSQKRIAPKNFLDYSLRLPQDIREQKAIAEILVDMDSEIQALNKKIIQYRKLKTGMMQQLLTGKIRLV